MNHRHYNQTLRRTIMARHHPMTWTAVHLALASVATWLLVESEALTGAMMVAFH